MELFIIILLLVVGIVLVVKGGDFFVDASSWIAEVSGMPKFLIGATIVSIATTLPELLVSVMAASRGEVDMSIGNAVGSVTANIGLIMAISIIFMASSINRKDYIFKTCLMFISALIIVICGLFKEVNIVFSILLLSIFIIFTTENVLKAKKSLTIEQDNTLKQEVTKKIIIINILKFVLGAGGIVYGANLLVNNGSSLARILGVDERIIGVTIIAIGTSLPELITTITAIAKKQSALSIGNILGANIIDLTLIMPLSMIISGKNLPISQTSALIDLPACFLVGIVALLPALITSKFKRWQGYLLLVLYITYVTITCII